MAKVDMDRFSEIVDNTSNKETRITKMNQMWYRANVGKNAIAVLEPHDEMNGIPFVSYGKHYNVGPEENITTFCRRPNNERHLAKECPLCYKAMQLNIEGTERSKKQARKFNRVQRYYAQVVDVSPIIDIDEDEKEYPKMPNCCYQYPDDEAKIEKYCNKCVWQSACQRGIIRWSFGNGFYKNIFVEIMREEKKNIADIENPIPIEFKREGEGPQDTRYFKFKPRKKFKFPLEVQKFLEKNLYDLTKAYKMPSKEELINKMNGIQISDNIEKDPIIGESLPKCYGKNFNNEDNCITCKHAESCEIETLGEVPSDNNSDNKFQDVDKLEKDLDDIPF